MLEKNKDLLLTLFVIGAIILQLALVYMAVMLNKWHGSFFDALQDLDKEALYKLIKTFCLLIAAFIVLSVTQYVCQARLSLNWRKFLTEEYCTKWVKGDAYFGSNLLTHKNDNPDQRISEDLNSFVDLTVELSFGLLSSVVTLVSFLIMLWSLSGIIKFNFFDSEIVIYGYLVWAALIYSVIGTIITYRVGRRLAGVDYLQEQKEANFRFSMMKVRENAESISLYKGGEYENNIFKDAFNKVFNNTLSIISINKNLKIWGIVYVNFASILPIIIASPKLFAKEIKIGGLIQISQAFDKVYESFSFLVLSFKKIAAYQAVVDRLMGFNDDIERWDKVLSNNKIKISEHASDELSIKNLTIDTPTKIRLIDNLNLSFIPGKSYLITGKNGAGKSTLIKSMAGIWAFGEGEIIFPKDKSRFFIPQSPYMSSGTLMQVIMYPDCKIIDEQDVVELMNQVNINYLVNRLDLTENWAISLSLGEQQKIAILRAIIHKPDILIMDESSSSLTENDEKLAYQLIKNQLPNATIISVGHRHSLKKFHDHEIDVSI